MNTLIIGMTIGLIGKVTLGVAVIRVHMHLAEERKIDGDVIRAIEREKYVTVGAIFLMIAGYLLETAYFMGFFA